MAITRSQGIKEINIGVETCNDGISIDESLFANLDYEHTYLEQVRSMFDRNLSDWRKTKLPVGFRFLDSGFYNPIYFNPKSNFKITQEGDKFFLVKGNGSDFSAEIEIEHKPDFYNKQTSDGKDMSRIVQSVSRGRLFIAYSNECSLKDKGQDCLFCNINDTSRRFCKVDNIEWKTPNQIGESVAEAYREGFIGFNLTGGFIPERREVDYYIDVIDSVKEHSDVPEDQIHGFACIGATSDLSIIEKYREAGYQHIGTNMEIWDENLFKYICPGKELQCGGRKNWINALKHEVSVFGKGKVRSNFVGGLEHKESPLEGIETLAGLGVIAVATIWNPRIGSALEGHRSPDSEWHQEVQYRIYQILKKNGYTLEDLYYVSGENNTVGHYFALDGETLPWEKPLELIKSA